MKFDSLSGHLRYAARSLIRRPILTIVAVITLGLGIGANTAIFSIINVVLLKSLPFRNPERLAMVVGTAPDQGLDDGFSSYLDFRDYREQAKTFEDIAAFWTFPNGDVNLTGGSDPQRVSVARITPGFFEVLGVPPLRGRTFLEEETVAGNHRRVILSYGLWQRDFGSDTTLVGQSVTVNGFPYTVVGIMPPQIQSRSVHALGTDVDLWRPLVPEDNQTGDRDSRKLRVVGRLAQAVTLAQAEAELAGIAQRLETLYPETNRNAGARVLPLRDQVVKDVRRALIFLLAAVAVVLIGACVNVANLLLIKAVANSKQFAIQHALGASRSQLVSQVLMESLLLGVSGALLGVMVAFGAVKAVVALGPAEIPLMSGARIDLAVLGFTMAATLVTVILVGLVPAWRSSRPEVTMVLRQAGSKSRGRDDRRLMGLLSVSQVAIAIVLLIAGGLLLRSFQALLEVDPGLETNRVLTFQLELPMATTYPTQEGRDAFFRNLIERVEGLPGVSGATIASAPPLEEEPSAMTFTRPGSEDDRVLQANFRMVAEGYFSLLGIPILQGRAFEETDTRASPRVVMISASLARSVWGNSNPVGNRIAVPFFDDTAVVIGVAGDVRTTGLDGEASRTVYVNANQGTYNFMTTVVRTSNDPEGLVAPVRRLVGEMDADLPLHHVRTMKELVARSVAQQRFQVFLVGSFSLVVFVLAVVGTYGVASYSVSERTSELGIRMALGATGGDIRRLVLREAGLITLIGLVVGAAAAAALSGTLTRFVFQISTLDLVTFILAPLVLGAASLVATLIPAHRATQVDPTRVLRVD